MEKVSILIIDDHPLQIEGYKTVLNFNQISKQIEVVPAYDIGTAHQIITSESSIGRFDIIILDWSLPPYPEMKINSGEDVAILIQKHLPEAKIMVITSHCEAFLLYNILRKTDPAALIVKSDCNAAELLEAFESVLNGETFYSPIVTKSYKELTIRMAYLDKINREIIMLLADGVKTKNIPLHVNLAKSTVEKRKVLIKEFLGLEKGNDEDIVREARRLGYI